MPYIMKVTNWKLPCLAIFGNYYDTYWVRDLIYAVDLAKGHV